MSASNYSSATENCDSVFRGNNCFSPVVTSDECPMALHNALKGTNIFLLCGGPSLIDVDESKLYQRGVLTCAVNNAATVVRPNYWVSYDPPLRFADAIFRDPAIIKFVLKRQLTGAVHARDASGNLVDTGMTASDFPNVFGYLHNNQFDADLWLAEPTVNCGQVNDEEDDLGLASGRSVMFAALKLLYYLGARRVFLVGCDFGMSYGKRSNYAFTQNCSRAVVRGNNRSYRILSARFEQLKPHFDRAGYEVYNCTERSNLKVFPFMPLDDAIAIATSQFPKTINTEGMYDQRCKDESNPG